VIRMSETSADGTYLEVDADGSNGAPAAVAAVLESVADTLRESPEDRRYDFELQIEERDRNE